MATLSAGFNGMLTIDYKYYEAKFDTAANVEIAFPVNNNIVSHISKHQYDWKIVSTITWTYVTRAISIPSF